MMRIVVADEISPDSCRLWDIETNDKLDKDRFRRDLGGLVEAYQEVARRLGIVNQNEPPRGTGRCWSSRADGSSEVIRARVTVTLKNGVLDPQGKAIEGALGTLGFDGVDQVRQGKVFDIELTSADRNLAEKEIADMCEKLLANTVIEDYASTSSKAGYARPTIPGRTCGRAPSSESRRRTTRRSPSCAR